MLYYNFANDYYGLQNKSKTNISPVFMYLQLASSFTLRMGASVCTFLHFCIFFFSYILFIIPEVFCITL